MPKSKRDKIPEARALYADGLTVDQVASAVGVTPSTVYRWKDADEKAGVDWREARNQTLRKDPRAALNVLERRFQRLVEDDELAIGKYSDAVHKLDTVIHRMRERYGDIATTLAVLGAFAVWARDNVADEDLAVLLRAHEAYLADLKRRHSG